MEKVIRTVKDLEEILRMQKQDDLVMLSNENDEWFTFTIHHSLTPEYREQGKPIRRKVLLLERYKEWPS